MLLVEDRGRDVVVLATGGGERDNVANGQAVLLEDLQEELIGENDQVVEAAVGVHDNDGVELGENCVGG